MNNHLGIKLPHLHEKSENETASESIFLYYEVKLITGCDDK